MAIFNSYMFVYQRVTGNYFASNPCAFPWLILFCIAFPVVEAFDILAGYLLSTAENVDF